jgi:hypothetical protein
MHVFIDFCQGRTKDDRKFGYVGINGRGGWFFAHDPNSLQNTLASIEPDTTDEPQHWTQCDTDAMEHTIAKMWNGTYGERTQ